MARPRSDGQPSRPISKHKLSDAFVRGLKHSGRPYPELVWDTKISGLAICIQPTGRKTWKCIYSYRGKPRWLTIGKTDIIDVSKARELAATALLKIATGVDVQAEKLATRGEGTFAELADRYRDEVAKKKNKSWEKTRSLVEKHLLPPWGKVKAADITRSDMKHLLLQIAAPSMKTMTLAAASPIFSWAIREEIFGVKVNPCVKIETPESESRERVLRESEIPLFWQACNDVGFLQGIALKVVLLCGQRPGEVRHLRREHLKDNWWEMPGRPIPELGWPGTKNGENHRVYLSSTVQALLDEVDGTGQIFERVILDGAMRDICKKLKIERCTPHDLRRSCGTLITGMSFGRQAMDRILNHTDAGVGGVYDRYGYATEDKRIMEAVAAKVMNLVAGKTDSNVVNAKFGR